MVDQSVRHVRVTPLPLILAMVTAVTAVSEIVAVALSWRLEPVTDTIIYSVYSMAMAAAGMLLASRHERNPIGWLMLWLGGSNAVLSDLAQGYGQRAAEYGWPAGIVAEWTSSVSVVVQMVPMFVLWLVFPTGRLLNRAWFTVVVAGGIASVLAMGGYSFSKRADTDFVGGTNPYVVSWLPTDAMWTIGNVFLIVALVGSAAALVVRFHRSATVERQQLKLLAFAALIAVVVLPLGPVVWDRYPVMRALVALVALAQPVAISVAMFRYRLYDVDRVISRTISYSLVTTVLVALYVVTVVTLGAIVGQHSAWATAGATLAAATAFRPLSGRARVLIDRRFDRDRYAALARIDKFVNDLRAGRATPEYTETLLREVTGDPKLTIHHRPHVDDSGRVLQGFPVRVGDGLAAIVTGGRALAERRSLVSEALAAAGLAIEIAGLRIELRRQLDEVEASRARLVVVADQERRRLERDLHDGAQQRLVSIGLALRHAQHQLRADATPDASQTIDGAVAEIAVAIDELRELAHGLRPSSLEAGLGPALRELVERVPLAVIVDTTTERFIPEAEATAYFVACEALTNTVKHAHAHCVTVAATKLDGTLVLRIADDGVGGATPLGGTGLRGMEDRLAAIGGTLTIDSCRTGTTITANIPCVS